MDEIEVKIIDINRKEIEEKLASLGAKKIFDDILYAFIFDFEDNRFQKDTSSLRIRKEGEESILNFKKLISSEEVKFCKEYEVKVSDFNVMKKILEILGLKIKFKYKKHRTSYALEGVKFEIDNYLDMYKFIPEFLEVETKDAKTLEKYVKKLGYSKKECNNWSLSQLINHYK